MGCTGNFKRALYGNGDSPTSADLNGSFGNSMNNRRWYFLRLAVGNACEYVKERNHSLPESSAEQVRFGIRVFLVFSGVWQCLLRHLEDIKCVSVMVSVFLMSFEEF